MVKLGFIREGSQSPPDFPRVYVRPVEKSDAATDGAVTTTVYSWPGPDGVQLFELALDVPPGAEHVREWAPHMAQVLIDMGWNTWWIDSFSLSMTMDRYITEALRIWGLAFWEYYKADAIVLVQVGLQREAVNLSISAWREKYAEVRFSNSHDFDAMEREQEQMAKQRGSKFKSLLKPKFLSTRRAT